MTISGVALTRSDFNDGGGYVADGTAGIAVLLEDGAFSRGDAITISGEIDDRYHQRTLRGDAAGLSVTGSGTDPAAPSSATGAVGEALEGRLARIAGTIIGSPSALVDGTAYDLDDGTGPVRLVVGSATGIDDADWDRGTSLELTGVVGQRDSTSGGTAGYRMQPRDAADVRAVASPASPSPAATTPPAPGASPTAGPSTWGPLVRIAEARTAPKNARLVVRGVVTMGTGVVDAASAVFQDASGAILLRLGTDAGPLARGQLIEVEATRSTLSGMESLRVATAPRQLGRQPEPDALRRTTGAAGEADEARLVLVRGALATAPRRASSGSISFDIDDGSGSLRVFVPGAVGGDADGLAAGAWVEVRGILGQQTTGALPLEGYRVWPRAADDLRLLAAATSAESGASAGASDGAAAGGAATGPSLQAVMRGEAGGGTHRVAVTLMVGAWPELDLAGVLWDGTVAVGLADTEATRTAVDAGLGDGGPPVAVTVETAGPSATHAELGLRLLALDDPDQLVRAGGATAAPMTELPIGDPAWVRLTGRLSRTDAGLVLVTGDERIDVDERCADASSPAADGEIVSVDGLAVGGEPRVVTGCEGIQAAPRVALARATGGMKALQGPGPDDVAAGPGSREGPPRAAAAALLALAFLIVAGAAAHAWHASRRTPAGDETGVGDPAITPQSDEEPSSPQLTLVSLPRERGSP